MHTCIILIPNTMWNFCHPRTLFFEVDEQFVKYEKGQHSIECENSCRYMLDIARPIKMVGQAGLERVRGDLMYTVEPLIKGHPRCEATPDVRTSLYKGHFAESRMLSF